MPLRTEIQNYKAIIITHLKYTSYDIIPGKNTA